MQHVWTLLSNHSVYSSMIQYVSRGLYPYIYYTFQKFESAMLLDIWRIPLTFRQSNDNTSYHLVIITTQAGFNALRSKHNSTMIQARYSQNEFNFLSITYTLRMNSKCVFYWAVSGHAQMQWTDGGLVRAANKPPYEPLLSLWKMSAGFRTQWPSLQPNHNPNNIN